MDVPFTNLDRRSVLRGGLTIFGGSLLARASFGAQASASTKPPRSILILELSGGNDGLSTVVPVQEKSLFQVRERVGPKREELLSIRTDRSLHRYLASMQDLFKRGQLAIVEGAGYPRPDRSHFTSQDIWYTAREAGRASGEGWAGRLVAELYPDDKSIPHAIHIGSTVPYTLHSSTHPVVYLAVPSAYRYAKNAAVIAQALKHSEMDDGGRAREEIRATAEIAERSSLAIRRAIAQYKPRLEYPRIALGDDLRNAAAILQSGFGARVMSVTQTGYDTHDDQVNRQDRLLRELDACLATFLADLEGSPAGEQTLVLVFSEFGRRVEDNASMGTDHGTAAPMFLCGPMVRGGIHGEHPSLTKLDEGDLIFTTDFRRVYAAVIEQWFGLGSERILGAKYTALPLIA